LNPAWITKSRFVAALFFCMFSSFFWDVLLAFNLL